MGDGFLIHKGHEPAPNASKQIGLMPPSPGPLHFSDYVAREIFGEPKHHVRRLAEHDTVEALAFEISELFNNIGVICTQLPTLELFNIAS